MFFLKYFCVLQCLIIIFPIPCFSLELQDIKIKEYYWDSSKILPLHKKLRWSKRENLKYKIKLKVTKYSEKVEIILRPRKCDLVIKNVTVVHILNGSSEENKTTEKISEYGGLLEGYVRNFPYNSSVSGYIKNNFFYGQVIINNTLYYADENRQIDISENTDNKKRKNSKQNAIIYSIDSVDFKRSNYKSSKKTAKVRHSAVDFVGHFRQWRKNGKLCSLAIVVDYSYLTIVHKSNQDATLFQILFSLEEANSIFRSTDFDNDGKSDNIGFYVKNIVILNSKNNPYFVQKYSNIPVNIDDFMSKFVMYKELKNHCLGILFTAQKFTRNTLGASFTADSEKFTAVGGICETHFLNRAFNALVITAASGENNLVPQIIFEVTIAHEIGHSFGSFHDESTKCSGFIMSPKTFKDYKNNRNHLIFSPCSKSQIIRTLVMKGECLEPVNTTFCGNGIVEDSEECDCGMSLDCLLQDPCCVPRRTKFQPCKVNRKSGYECHPSQGPCCDEKCKYSTSITKYVECKNFDRSCPCPENQLYCKCGIHSICIQNECHSAECARLNLKECQCESLKSLDGCSICCNYMNQCIPAVEATEKILSEQDNAKSFQQILEVNKLEQNSDFKYQRPKWFLKKFCSKESNNINQSHCVYLPFFQGKSSELCLHRGILGKFDQTCQCNIFSSHQRFPSFKSGCVEKFFNHLTIILLYALLVYQNKFT